MTGAPLLLVNFDDISQVLFQMRLTYLKLGQVDW